jgi:hypothetical protein
LAPKRIAESLKPEAGVNLWIALRWYPVILLLYGGGIAAVAAGRYEKLRQLVDATIAGPESARGYATLVRAVTRGLGDARNAFYCLPWYERRQCPFSDYIFDLLRPILDELVFLGSEYESHFDRFEACWHFSMPTKRGGIGFPLGDSAGSLIQVRGQAPSICSSPKQMPKARRGHRCGQASLVVRLTGFER